MQNCGTPLPRQAYDHMNERVRTAVRPMRVAPWQSMFTAVESQKPTPPWREEQRRKDITQSYGHGTPTVPSSRTYKNSSIGVGKRGSFQAIATEEGFVNVPVEFQDVKYSPSVSTLESIAFADDTRLQPRPDRFFR